LPFFRSWFDDLGGGASLRRHGRSGELCATILRSTGLRAVAILFVILFHSAPNLGPGGWVGVDVFFALSGYLITSILRREIEETGRVNWRWFYMRRALRLTPALLCLVAFLLVLSAFTPYGSELRQSTLIGAFYLENWNKVFNFGPHHLIGHTWSLATEEQFYLLWPATLLLILNKRPAVWIGGAIAFMLAARLAVWSAGGAEDHLLFGLDVRPVGLLGGALLALFRPPALPAFAPFVALGALVAIALFGSFWSAWSLVAAPVTASLAALVLIISALHDGLTTRLLAWAPLVYVGQISYGLYLYSFPIFLLGEKLTIRAPFHAYELGLIAIIFATAAVSYEFVEKPCLRLKARLGTTRRVQPAAVAAQ
jgi:peptidoglycan/LPS O-acetylase OafA/YrhL